MRLVSWNCRSGFHRKLDSLATLAPDVAIVSECANLEILASKAPGLQPTSALWVGTNPHKGLGVFSFGDYRLVRDDRAYDPSITFALPVQVEGPSTWHVLALWAHHGLSGRAMSVRGPTLEALAVYQRFLRAGPAIVAGDLNNHLRWDRPGKQWNHANTIAASTHRGPDSAYHAFLGLEHGAEQHPTFYWRTRSADGPTYHIDYVFVPQDSLTLLTNVSVGSRSEWIATGLSDHVPVIVDFDKNATLSHPCSRSVSASCASKPVGT